MFRSTQVDEQPTQKRQQVEEEESINLEMARLLDSAHKYSRVSLKTMHTEIVDQLQTLHKESTATMKEVMKENTATMNSQFFAANLTGMLSTIL